MSTPSSNAIPAFEAGTRDATQPRVAGRAVRKIAFGALSVLSGIVFALALGELALRLVSPPPPGYRPMVPNLEATFNAQRYAKGVQSPAVFKVNTMGFRSREWAPDRASEYRILCLGGSTTESILNDQSRIWTTLLENQLGQVPDGRRVWVGNMGKDGLASKHHIAQLNHIKAYDPDLLIVLVGSSDLMSRLKQGDTDSNANLAYFPEKERILEEQSFAVLPDAFLWQDPATWYRSTRLWKLLAPLESAVFEKAERQDLDGASLDRWRSLRAAGRRADALPVMQAALDSYERNLKQMVRQAHSAAVPILFLTQPSIWRPDLTDAEKAQLWMGGVGQFREVPGSLYYEPEVLEQGMDAFNQRLLQVCHDTSSSCVDLAKAVPKSPDYFYDDEHFTDLGQRLVADRVAAGVSALQTGYQP